jgi:hypothetical protein
VQRPEYLGQVDSLAESGRRHLDVDGSNTSSSERHWVLLSVKSGEMVVTVSRRCLGEQELLEKEGQGAFESSSL